MCEFDVTAMLYLMQLVNSVSLANRGKIARLNILLYLIVIKCCCFLHSWSASICLRSILTSQKSLLRQSLVLTVQVSKVCRLSCETVRLSGREYVQVTAYNIQVECEDVEAVSKQC